MSQITDPAAALRFMRGGNATFTLQGRNNRYTYKVQAPSKPTEAGGTVRDFDSDVRFVKLLTGPDNTQDYSYIGTLFGDVFRVTAKSRVAYDTPSVKALTWTLDQLRAGKMPAALGFFHEGSCCRCGRALTVPASILSGIGPECAGKVA